VESALVGLILDTSIIVRAERRGETVSGILSNIREILGETEIGISVVTVAELTHGVQRSKIERQRERSQAFVDDVLAAITVHPVTTDIAQRVGFISGQGAERGVTLPFEDLLIGVTALQLEFELATHNIRHFQMIPGLIVKSL
jgi:predicted nucleic acid-binding protein